MRRFIVDPEGQVKEEHSTSAKPLDVMDFKRMEREARELADRSTEKMLREHQRKFERHTLREQYEPAGKTGIYLIFFGIGSLTASKTPSLLWSGIFGIVGIILLCLGGLMVLGSIIIWLELMLTDD